MSEFKKLSLGEVSDLLLSVSNPAILMHKRPDGDTVGSAMALYLILSSLNKSPCLICCDEIPQRLRFILRDISLAKYEENMSVIAVDVASRAQMGDLSESIKSPYLMIDHHAIGEPFADSFILPEASSAGEVVFEIASELVKRGKIQLTSSIALAIYTAICSDTGSFAFSNTSAKTHITAARLIELGVDAADIYRRLFATKPLSQIKAESFVSSNIKTALDGRVAYATVTLDEMSASGAKLDDFETAIDVIRVLEGVLVAFVIKETKKGEMKVSLRSPNRNVAEIAAAFGGGGHIRAAGCTVYTSDIDYAASVILKKINDVI